jgi:DNA invertase Pin-like site-specific DNA recombinase
MAATQSTKTGIYARISDDDEGRALGVQRQLTDCQREAERRRWTVTGTYVDNDVSATRSKRRPEYERLMTDIRSGAITALVVWDVDRLTRKPRELEDIIDLADTTGLQLASVGGEIDLSTPQGRLTARIKGSVARHETDQSSRRIKRKFDANASEGKPHGTVSYGWDRVDKADVLNPEQADIIRGVAKRLLEGESLRSIVKSLNAEGRLSPKGMPWESTTLRQIMLRDRNAGLRVHRGQVVGKGVWEAIYDEDTHVRIKTLLTDPNRRSAKGNTRKHLGTGLYRCGRDDCSGTVKVNVPGKGRPNGYYCPDCNKVRRKQDEVDAMVDNEVIRWLQDGHVMSGLAAGEPETVQTARDTKAALNARLEAAADSYADGEITSEQLTRITGRLRPQIEDAEKVIESHSPAYGLMQFMNAKDIRKAWKDTPLDAKRATIKALLTITILPVGHTVGGFRKGGGYRPDFDPASVKIELTGGIRELVTTGGWKLQKRDVTVGKRN